MIQVAQFMNRIQAEMWLGPLKEKNIPYVVQCEDCGGVRPELIVGTGLKILIANHDLDRIKEIYPEIEDKNI